MGKEKNIFWRLQNDLSPSHKFYEMETWLCLFETKIKNGKQRFRKNVWQNSRCHIQNIHLQVLPCEDISIEKGICVSYCQKEDVEAAGWRKKGAPQKKSSTFLKVFLIDTVKIMNF